MDIALVSGTEATFAFTGTEWYAGQKMPNLRAVAALVPNMTGYFVRANSPMRTVADLKGKRVSTGFDAQPTAALLSKSVLPPPA